MQSFRNTPVLAPLVEKEQQLICRGSEVVIGRRKTPNDLETRDVAVMLTRPKIVVPAAAALAYVSKFSARSCRPKAPQRPSPEHSAEAQETEHTSSKSLVLMTSMTYAQAEGAAIAAAVFASVGRAEAEAQPDETLPEQDGPGLPGSEPARPRVRSRKPKKKARRYPGGR